MADVQRILSDVEGKVLEAIQDIRSRKIRPDKSKVELYLTKRFNFDAETINNGILKLQTEGVIFCKMKRNGESFYVNKRANVVKLPFTSDETNTIRSTCSDISSVDEQNLTGSIRSHIVRDENLNNSILPDNKWLFQLINSKQGTIASLVESLKKESEKNRLLEEKLDVLTKTLSHEKHQLEFVENTLHENTDLELTGGAPFVEILSSTQISNESVTGNQHNDPLNTTLDTSEANNV